MPSPILVTFEFRLARQRHANAIYHIAAIRPFQQPNPAQDRRKIVDRNQEKGGV